MELNKAAENLRKNLAAFKKTTTTDNIAKSSGVNYNTIIKLLSGANQNPTLKTLVGLSNALGITVGELIGE